MPTFVVEVVELSRDFVKTERKNKKSFDRVNDLKRESKDVRLVERLACVDQKAVMARIKTLEARAKDVDAKYAKMVGKKALVEGDLHSRTLLLKSSLKAKNDCVDKVARDESVLAPSGSAREMRCYEVSPTEEKRNFARGA